MEGAACTPNSAGKVNGCAPCKSSPHLPTVMKPLVELIYWRDVKKSGAALSVSVLLLLALSFCSLISVLAYASLLTLSSAAAFRVYKNISQAVQKTQDGHPFKEWLAVDLSLTPEKAHMWADVFLAEFNCGVKMAQRFFLVDDLIDSFKFGLGLYALTYVGAWFNGLTLLLLAVLAAFSLPKAYEMHQPLVDQYLGLACQQISMVMDKVKAVVPMGGAGKKEQ